MWCVECEVWCVECGVLGVLSVVLGVLSVVFGVVSVECGVCGVWCAECGVVLPHEVVGTCFASVLDCTYSNHMTLGMRERSLSSSQPATRLRTSQGNSGVNTN